MSVLSNTFIYNQFHMKNSIRETLAVKTVMDAIGLIYNHFGDPMYERHPELIKGVEALQNYVMSKDAWFEILKEEISLVEKYDIHKMTPPIQKKWTKAPEVL